MRGCNWQYFLVVPTAEKETAEGLANQVFKTEGIEYLTARLSASGASPATHYALATWANENLRTTFTTILSSGALSGIKFDRINLPNGKLAKTNINAAKEGLSWSWAESLTELGLQMIHEEL